MAVLNRRMGLYLSHPHPCDYLSGETTQIVYLPPDRDISMHTYSQLIAQGFRRSGRLVYRPRCPACSSCVPVRIPVNRFCPSRSQSRCWKRNQDLDIFARKAGYDKEHYQLYLRYLKARHPGGSMVESTTQDYLDFLTCTWCDTLFYEFRYRGDLLAVAVVDLLDDGLSAIYTFFDPEKRDRGLGNFAILWEIEAAKRMGMERLYLGYWIEHCGKMAYKRRFQPLEMLVENHWQCVQSDFQPDRRANKFIALQTGG